MNLGADVRSIAALREWLAAVQVYSEECAEALSGVRLEIRRGIDWVTEQRDLWQRAIRQCEEEVVQAKAELSARRFPDFSGRMPDTTVQERNLRRAEARLEHAQEQVARCKKWEVQLPRIVDEVFSGAGHRLGIFLESDLTRGTAALTRQVEALELYAGTRMDFAPAPSVASMPTLAAPEPPKPEEPKS